MLRSFTPKMDAVKDPRVIILCSETEKKKVINENSLSRKKVYIFGLFFFHIKPEKK